MRFGVYFPNQGAFADVGVLVALAREAEAAGWDGMFIWDALLPVFPHSPEIGGALGDSTDVADAFVAMTAIASATDRLRFGAMVTPLPRLRPEAFAQQTATLDRYSQGRLILGVGLGNPDIQFSGFGYPADLRLRAEMTDEFLDVLTQLWTGEVVTFRGKHYTVDHVALSPRPHQQPRIPIWIGADHGRRRPLQRAARWDGFVPAAPDWPHGVIPPSTYRRIKADIDVERRVRTPFDLVVIGSATTALPPRETLREYEAGGVTWFLVQALTVDDARERVRQGPRRAHRTAGDSAEATS